jgi:hypothetical protein
MRRVFCSAGPSPKRSLDRPKGMELEGLLDDVPLIVETHVACDRLESEGPCALEATARAI